MSDFDSESTEQSELTPEQEQILAHHEIVEGFKSEGFLPIGPNTYGFIEDGVLTVKMDLNAPCWDSKRKEDAEGNLQPAKSDMIASTKGNKVVREDGLRLSVNVYRPKTALLG